jgi:DNA polymerase-3 subunit delta'
VNLLTRWNGSTLTPFDISRFQNRAWKILARSFEARRIAGTYLFHGREGVGRWALGISFAALLNCENPRKEETKNEYTVPCGACRNCRNVFSLNFEGFYYALPIPSHKNLDEAVDLTNEILQVKREEPFKILSSTASTTIPVAVARDIKKKLSYRSTEGITRVVLFYQMERMLAASADALLKLIEEPPPDTVIILTAERPESLLPTIQSRAQKVRLHRIPEEAIVSYLTEKHNLPDTKAKLLARISQGSLGQAVEMIETSEEEDSSRRAVGLLLFKSLLTEPSPMVVAHMADLLSAKDRGEAEDLLELWQSLIRDCTHYALTGSESEVVNIDFSMEIQRLSNYFVDSQVALRMVEDIKTTLADLRRNVHIQGALIALALRLRSHLPGCSQVASRVA